MPSRPDRAAPYRTLPAARVADPATPGKSFFALELAVAVASGTAAAGRFAVPTPGPVLLLAAEDPPAVVVQRLAALAAARDHAIATLPVERIVTPASACPRASTASPRPSRASRRGCSSSIR